MSEQMPVTVHMQIPSDTRYLAAIGCLVDALVETREPSLGYPLQLALTEAVANAIKHGTRNQASDEVGIDLFIDAQAARMRVHDHGPGFDLESVRVPDDDELSDHGRGLQIIRALVDSLSYGPSPAGNTLEMIKFFPPPAAAEPDGS
ncbi:MAG: ATP-binding protein [bacterium]|nr:ATP-binding protein [bacterium]